ncbi:MAG: hypothetical protein ONB05_09815, partial [candidate division KSB1 bacterium]|nr:hypothetical protein [candidate division KSB1 bacterium]
IYDRDGVLVTRAWDKRMKLSGPQRDSWDGRIFYFPWVEENLKPGEKYQNAKLVPPGKYLLKFKIEPTYSSYHYFAKKLEVEIEIK